MPHTRPVTADTSPRGVPVEGDDENWDFGTGGCPRITQFHGSELTSPQCNLSGLMLFAIPHPAFHTLPHSVQPMGSSVLDLRLTTRPLAAVVLQAL